MITFNVAEKFISLNGEGKHAGERAAFIRLAGCNLNCSYCDTRWANDGSEFSVESIDDIVAFVTASGVGRVTLTGGEPMLKENVFELIVRLIETCHKVEVETNGAVDLSPFYEMAGGLHLREELEFTVDYKCPSSGMEEHMVMTNFEHIRQWDTVKFVVGSHEDLEKAEQVIRKYDLDLNCSVFLSPVFGNIKPVEIADFIIEKKLNGVRLQLQQHKIIWPPDARGV